MKIGEQDSLRGQLVQRRRANISSITTKVSIPKVIGDNQQYVRTRSGLLCIDAWRSMYKKDNNKK